MNSPRKIKAPMQQKEISGLQPPQAVEVEKNLIGAALKDKNAFLEASRCINEPEVFYKDAHKIIFKAMIDLDKANEAIDILTVSEMLKKSGSLNSVGGELYLMELARDVVFSENIESHAKIINEKHILRMLITSSRDITAKAFDNPENVDELLDTVEKQIFDIASKKSKSDFSHISADIGELLQKINDVTQSGKSSGIPTGYPKLDALTGGIQDTDMLIVAGRPGTGKTSFALSLAANMAIKAENKVPVAIFSLEMSKIQLLKRLLCAEARIDMHALNTGRLSTKDLQRLANATTPMANAPMYIDDTPGISVMEMRAKARRLKSEHNIGIIFIDYLQLMTASSGDGNFQSRENEISYISRSIKGLAKDLDIPIFALSQLNRSVESRSKDARPQLSDLRESGAIEQDADIVMFVYRPKDDDMGPEGAAKSEIIVEKQRNGPTGSIPVTFIGKYTRFENVEVGEEDGNQWNQGIS